MASAFGDVDYTKLNRVQGALDVATNAMLRNEVAKVGAEKEQADKAIAAQASTMFSQAIAPKEAQKTTNPVATGLSAGTVDQTARPTGEGMQEASDAEVLRAAAQAGEILAKGGGPHSQAAAKRISDYLDARVKFKTLGATGGRRREYVDVAETPDAKNWPLRRTIGNEIQTLQKQIYSDTGQPTGEYGYTKGGLISQSRTGLDDRERTFVNKLEAKKQGLEMQLLGKHPSINLDAILAQKDQGPLEPGTGKLQPGGFKKNPDGSLMHDENDNLIPLEGKVVGGTPDKLVQEWLFTIGQIENILEQRGEHFTRARDLAAARLGAGSGNASPQRGGKKVISLQAARERYEKQEPGSTKHLTDEALKRHVESSGVYEVRN